MKRKQYTKLIAGIAMLSACFFANQTSTYGDTIPLAYEASGITENFTENTSKEYAFTTPDTPAFTTITVTNTSCSTLAVTVSDKDYKAVFKKSTSIQGEPLSYTFETTEKQNFYVSVQGDNGDCQITMTKTDDVGGSSETNAVTLTETNPIELTMDGEGDTDYLLFTPTGTGTVQFVLSNKTCSNAIQANIVQLSSKAKKGSIGSTAVNASSKKNVNLTAGETYLLTVSGASYGSYTVEAKEKHVTAIAMPATLSLSAGSTYQLVPSVTHIGGNAPFVTFTSSTSAAAIDANGTITAIKPGKATIKVVAADGFHVYAKTTLYVAPGKMTTPTISTKKTSSSQLVLKWDKMTNVSGYYVYQYTDGSWKKIRTISSGRTTSCTVNGLNSASTCRFRISAYKKMNHVIFEGAKSATATYVTPPNQATISSVTYDGTTLKVTPYKLSGVNGYEIRYSPSRSFSTYYTYSSNSSALSLKPLIANGTWYVQIRAYKLYDGTPVYGNWSAAKGVEIY